MNIQTSIISMALAISGLSLQAQVQMQTQQADPILSNVLYTKGDNGYNTFRIPGVVQSTKGTLLAFAEGRKNSKSDTGNIDIFVRRSTDGGKTWGDMILVWDDADNVCGNPAPVVDKQTGRIILLSTWNLGTDHEKQINQRLAEDTRRVYMLYSDDDGVTWSDAEQITSTTKRPEWTWYATGPCHGIQLQKGKHKGRIVFPCDYGEFIPETKSTLYHSHVIYSDNGGKTWNIGGDSERGGNESTITELTNGDLMLNMRGSRDPDRDKLGSCRGVTLSHDAGVSFGKTYYDKALIEPVCQGSILNYTPKGKLTKTILFSNPNSKSKRYNLTIKISKDSGETWTGIYHVNDRATAYSDMVVMPSGDVAVLYEDGETTSYDQISFKVIPAKVFK